MNTEYILPVSLRAIAATTNNPSLHLFRYLELRIYHQKRGIPSAILVVAELSSRSLESITVSAISVATKIPDGCYNSRKVA
jgi:hypothetical protein